MSKLNGWQRLWLIGTITAGLITIIACSLFLHDQSEREQERYTGLASYYEDAIKKAEEPVEPNPLDAISAELGLPSFKLKQESPDKLRRDAADAENYHSERLSEIRADKPLIILGALCAWFFFCTGCYGLALGLFRLTQWVIRGGFRLTPKP
jgi:hypothetical protein